MCSSSTSRTIYIGNIPSISDEQLREYFQKLGKIEALYQNCSCDADKWFIDYRFIRFSPDTNMNNILTNKFDHMIGRIRLDIHPHDAVFRDETRLMSDRKICVAHENITLNRNAIKKFFSKYGRILNCTCVSSGKGVEYTYIEFETINSIQSVLGRGERHFLNRTPLTVKRLLRPTIVEVKTEPITIDDKTPTTFSRRLRFNSKADTVQYSSNSSNRHRIDITQLQTSSSCPSQLSNLSSNSDCRLSTRSNIPQLNNNDGTLSDTTEPIDIHSCKTLKDYEHEYDLVIQQDFDEITYQIEHFLRNQRRSYRNLRSYILKTARNQTNSSSSEQGKKEEEEEENQLEPGEIESSSSSSSSTVDKISEKHRNKRCKLRH